MSSDIKVEVISSPQDVRAAFDVVYQCFGVQVPDAIIFAYNPGVETPKGRADAAQRYVDRFIAASKIRNNSGQMNSIFLKATAYDNGQPKIVGFCIWEQLSVVDGYGNPPVEDIGQVMDLEKLYPGDISEQEYVVKMDRNLHVPRTALVKSKRDADPPAILALDLMVTHPQYQRRGIARQCVQWGLDEAKRRGGLECSTEASVMGRLVYTKMGFKQEGGEIEYDVDEAKFAIKRGMPSNIFLRTGA